MATRVDALKARFPIGTKVLVSKHLPAPGEWPGWSGEMSQFFTGEELTVVGYLADPHSDRLAVKLNTSAHGPVNGLGHKMFKNHLFNVDWVSPSEAPKLEVKVIPTKQRKSSKPKLKVEIVSNNLEITFPEPFDVEVLKKDLVQEKPAEILAPPKEEKKPKEEVGGLGLALGAAFLTAFGTAVAQRKAEKKQQAQLSEETKEIQEEATVAK